MNLHQVLIFDIIVPTGRYESFDMMQISTGGIMDTRDMIIETAFKGFLNEGFDNVSLNSLVKSTGLS